MYIKTSLKQKKTLKFELKKCCLTNIPLGAVSFTSSPNNEKQTNKQTIIRPTSTAYYVYRAFEIRKINFTQIKGQIKGQGTKIK